MYSDRELAILHKSPKQLYVNGRWRASSNGALFKVEDPSTGHELCQVADATLEDAEDAVVAAMNAQSDWAATLPRERSEILRRAFDAIMNQVDDLALLITLEMGKPLRESRAEVEYGAEFLRWYAEEAVRVSGRYSQSPTDHSRILTIKQPVGPCLFITPWNFPLAMGTRKIGPAIAAGCSMIVKPAQQTPLTMLALVSILEEVGLPSGVCNVITTTNPHDIVAPLLGDGRIKKLSFTGSTAVGRQLMEQAAEQVLRVSMELGGNAPFIVFENADLDAAIEGAVTAKMRNMGQSCVAANRFLIAEPIAEDFARGIADKMAQMHLGRGTDDRVDVGPMIDDRSRQRIQALVDHACEKGAHVLSGGEVLTRPGHFYAPTVLAGVPEDAAIVQEEIFGPVAPILTFTDEEDAVRRANGTHFGLVAYVYTQDLPQALRVTERLEFGMVGLNRGLVSNAAAPFGGIKQSGLGREGGPEGMHEYLNIKYVAVDM